MTTEDLFWFDQHAAKKKQLRLRFDILTRDLERAPDSLIGNYRVLRRKAPVQALQGYKQALAIPNMPYNFAKYVRKKQSEIQHEFIRDKNNVAHNLHTLQQHPAVLSRTAYELECLDEEPEQEPQRVDTTGLDLISAGDNYLHIKRPATVAKLSSTVNVPSSVEFENEACIRIPPYVIKLNPTEERPTISVHVLEGIGFETSFNRNAPNPHCLGGGVPCFGDFISPIQEALEQQDLHLLVDVVDAFMRQINVVDSAGKQWVSILRYDGNKGHNPSNSRFFINADGVVSNILNSTNPFSVSTRKATSERIAFERDQENTVAVDDALLDALRRPMPANLTANNDFTALERTYGVAFNRPETLMGATDDRH